MANRILRDWTDSDKIDLLSADAERFFTRLIMKADDYGYFHAHPSLIIAALFPLKIDKIDLEDVEQWISECERCGLIITYTVNDRKYLHINNFNQRLRIMTPKFPQPADKCQQSAVNCPPETKRSRNEVEVEDEKQKTSSEKKTETGNTVPQTQSVQLGLSNLDRFKQSESDQQLAYKFAKGIGKISDFTEIFRHAQLHNDGLAMSKPNADYQVWLQYFRYYFENLKINGKTSTIVHQEPEPSYYKRVKFDERGKPYTE